MKVSRNFDAIAFSTILLATSIAGCSVNSDSIIKQKTYGAQVGVVNHTSQFIYSASVENGGGASSYPFHAGIANMCCVTLPEIWHPELVLRVRWDIPVGTEHRIKTKLVRVEKYDDVGSLYVHFFPNDEVRIVVTDWFGSNINHPIAPPIPGEKLESLYR